MRQTDLEEVLLQVEVLRRLERLKLDNTDETAFELAEWTSHSQDRLRALSLTLEADELLDRLCDLFQ